MYIKKIIEKVVDDRDMRIESIITFQNKKYSYEYYATDSSGYGF